MGGGGRCGGRASLWLLDSKIKKKKTNMELEFPSLVHLPDGSVGLRNSVVK